jgi:hypothetical protein
VKLPQYIQPVVEGDTRGALSESIWRPITSLARALQNFTGEVGVKVTLSDGRFVLDFAGTGFNETDDSNDRDPGEEGDTPDIPPWYIPNPPPANTDTSGWVSGYYYAIRQALHRKFGYRPFNDSDSSTGKRWLDRRVDFTGLENANDFNTRFGNPGSPFPDSGGATTRYSIQRLNRFYSAYLGEIATPTGASSLYSESTYANTLWASNESLIAASAEASSEESFTWTSANGAVATGNNTNRYTTRELYTDVFNLVTNCDFDRGSASYANLASGSQAFDAPTGFSASTDPLPTPIIYSWSNEAQENNISCSHNGVAAASVPFGHFTRKDKGGGSISFPTGKTVYVELGRYQFGHKTLAKTWYIHKYSVPKGHFRPVSLAGRTQFNSLPASATYLETETVNLAAEQVRTVDWPDETGYCIVNETITPTAVVTPLTCAAAQITLFKSTPDIRYRFVHDEPYLYFEIYRNTTNDSATATLITTHSELNPVDAGGGLWQFTYFDVDTFVGGTTYYYWHKAYYDASRKSGFSAVKSLTY